MGVNIWINRGKIYLDIYTGGKRWRESTGLSVCPDKFQNKEVMRLAEILRSKKELQVVSGANGLVDPVLSKQTLYNYMKTNGEKKDKKHKLNKCLPYLVKFDPNIQLGAITPSWFENFQEWLQKETSLAPQTCENYCCGIRALMKIAVRDSIIVKDPCTSIKHIVVPEKLKDYLTVQEIEKLIKTPVGGELGLEVRKAFLFSLCTGLRISDLKALKWGDINVDRMQIELRQGKTQRAVYIPLKAEAWKSIQDGTLHMPDTRVFPLLTASATNTNQYLNAWGKKAGVAKPMGWHIARHTFATLSLENGADLFTIQKLLGHTKIGTTQGYAKATDKKRREAIDALPDFGIGENQ